MGLSRWEREHMESIARTEIRAERDIDNRSTRISGRVFDRDLMFSPDEIAKDIRWQIATKVSDIVMEELEPAIREAIKNMKDGSK